MSNSRKYPIWKDRANKYAKRAASRAVRRCKDLENYKGYSYLKKLFNPWDISDWRFVPRNKEDLIKSSRK